jgi:hypothetical protein
MDLVETSSPTSLEFAWQNTKEELALLERLPNCAITLVVKDEAAMERAASAVGASFTFDRSTRAQAFTALNQNDASDWRSFTTAKGQAVSRGLLIGMAGDVCRKGVAAGALRSVVDACMFDGVSATDADVLLGLRAGGK